MFLKTLFSITPLRGSRFVIWPIAIVLQLVIATCSAQSPLSIYSDGLDNSFQDWSWASRNLSNNSPVHSGSKSISATAAAWEGISFYHSDIDTSLYSAFSFWAHGGASGGQRLQVYGEYGPNSGPAYTLPTALLANTWMQYTIPLTTLGIANKANFNRINLQLQNTGTTGTFYLDDIQLVPNPVPALINVSINATQTVRTVDERHFGVNLAMWDSFYDPPNHLTTISLLKEMGCTIVRMPGGSLSDEYHWGSNTTLSNTWQWAASFSEMVRVATNVGAQAFVTVNYGSGTPEEAAAWVRHANITNHLGFKYWEIGNECYGEWETDTNALAHHAYTYAVRATNYIAQMKAADPTIKIGVVSAPGESSYHNDYTDHPAYNPRTGQTNYGWTPILLSTLKTLGVTPDFLVHHHYPEWTNPQNPSQSSDNDLTLLQSTGNWASDAANLRQQITDYFGPAGTNIELVVTENNSDSGAQGRQSTSLVNGLYYADSLSRLLQTEFKSFVWWDLRNGTDTNGFFNPSIYGWRTYGDLGLISDLSTRHPTFYAAKLMQWFARPGDKILSATTDYNSLTTYATRRANGSVAVFLINKSFVTNLNTQISLQGYSPIAAATVRSYGVLNDEAARTNAPIATQDITTNSIANAGTNFTYSCPPLSMTLLTLAPAQPRLTTLPSSSPDQFIVRLIGQTDVRYVIQTSSNMSTWTSVSTNTLTGNTLDFTNSVISGSQKFWRSVWQP